MGIGKERGLNRRQQLRWLLPWVLGALLVSLLLTALDHRGSPLPALFGYLTVSTVAALALALGWRIIGGWRVPRAVTHSLLVAVVLRLALGFLLYEGLPRYGYDTKPNQQGYVYYDAYARDTDAWARGRSDKPLWAAFEERKASDQYGGLLFLSAGIYRYLSEGRHRPLMVVVLAAAFSSLAVLFTWAFTAMSLGTGSAAVAAWLVALYPDYVLLGASQMREAFVVPGLALALYGYARVRIGDQRGGFLLAGVALLLTLFISPLYALIAILLIAGLWMIEGRRGGWATVALVAAVLVISLPAVLLILQAWSGMRGLPQGGILGVLSQWLMRGAAFQLAELEEGSGWVQRLFAQVPTWAHMPLATVYGLTRPFLPAAVADNSGLPIWRAIAVWRAVGWTSLLPLLLYGPFAALGADRRRRLLIVLAVAVWVGAVVASYRAAGDLWDNPRYRTALLPLQAALAGWAWYWAKRKRSPWLRRSYGLVLGAVMIFLHWYLGRYYGSPRLGLGLTLAAIAVYGLLVVAGSLLLDRWRRRRATG